MQLYKGKVKWFKDHAHVFQIKATIAQRDLSLHFVKNFWFIYLLIFVTPTPFPYPLFHALWVLVPVYQVVRFHPFTKR